MPGEHYPSLGVDTGSDDLLQVPRDDLCYLVSGPAPAKVADLPADPLHPPVVGPAQPEGALRTCATQYRRPVDQAMPVERRREGQRAGAREDGLVEIEEGRYSSLPPSAGVLTVRQHRGNQISRIQF